MGRDKAKDDKFFNCSQEHELKYVSGLYPGYEVRVYHFLVSKCQAGIIKYSTHKQVYDLIEKELGLTTS